MKKYFHKSLNVTISMFLWDVYFIRAPHITNTISWIHFSQYQYYYYCGFREMWDPATKYLKLTDSMYSTRCSKIYLIHHQSIEWSSFLKTNHTFSWLLTEIFIYYSWKGLEKRSKNRAWWARLARTLDQLVQSSLT